MIIANAIEPAMAHPFLFQIPKAPKKAIEPNIKFETRILASSILFSDPSVSS